MYNAETKAAVIYLKAEGKSDRSIGRMSELKMPNGDVVKLPSRDTIEDWCNPDHPNHDAAFLRQYTRACEDSLWDEHEKLREINKQVEQGQLEPQAAKVVSDNIKWDLARRLRHIFGDKAEVDITSKGKQVGQPVTAEAIAEAALLLSKNLDG